MRATFTAATKRRLLLAVEVLLVAVILGLLLLTWLPAIVGARTG